MSKMAIQPDLIVKTVKDERKRFQHIHRYTDEDIYFIAANDDATPTATFSFRVSGKVPEFWYPDSGIIEPCTVYQEDGRTEIPLFDTYGSVFVVFREGKAELPRRSSIGERAVLSVEEPQPAPTYSVFETAGTVRLTMANGSVVEEAFNAKPTVTLNENWTVTFPEGDLTEAVTFKTLTPWNEHADERIRYFSGTAVYARAFNCSRANTKSGSIWGKWR